MSEEIKPGAPNPTPMTTKPKSTFDRLKAAIGFLWSDNSMFVEVSPQAEAFTSAAPMSMADVYSQVESQLYKTAAHNGVFTSQMAYRNYVYGNNFTNKPWRLASWRVIANSPEVARALDEIADSMMNRNERGQFFEFTVNSSQLSQFEQRVLEDEFRSIYNMFNFEVKGSEYCKRFLYEGELLWENIIDESRKERGIIGLKFVDPESYEYIVDIANNIIGFMFNAMILLNKQMSPQFQNYFNANPYFAGQVNGNIDFAAYGSGMDGKIMAMPVNQFTWVRDEANMNNNKTMILPHVARAQQIWRRLLLLKDALIIYRLVRAPMTRVFNVNVGRTAGNKTQAELQRFANGFKNRRVFNPQTGEIDADYDVHALTHNMFFAKDADGKGADVQNLEGGSPEFLKDLDDIKFVVRELYCALKVPFDRWENPAGETNWFGSEKLTYEEATFYKFIERQQALVAGAFKETFVTHLKLTGLWEKYGLIESDFRISMVPPPLFYAYVQKRALLGKLEIYKEMVAEEVGLFSKEYAAKRYFGMTDDEYAENVRLLEKEKADGKILEIKTDKAASDYESAMEAQQMLVQENPQQPASSTSAEQQQPSVKQEETEKPKEAKAEPQEKQRPQFGSVKKSEASPKKEEAEEPLPFENEEVDMERPETIRKSADELDKKLQKLQGK